MPHEIWTDWNYHYLLIYGTLICIFFYLILKHIRYDVGRELVLNLLCIMQGRKYKWIREPSLARRILSSSPSKGLGIEEMLSTRAFKPIISLESVNDEQWLRMKDNFLILKSHLPSLDELNIIAKEITGDYLNNPNITIIDSPTLGKLIVQIMEVWLFGSKNGYVDPKVLLAIEEWRKEIAIKGKGDPSLKMYAANWIQKLIRHSKYYEIFTDKWYLDEYWSLFLQPFFVSPVINITDLAVTLKSNTFQEDISKIFQINYDEPIGKSDMEQLIVSAINYNHPFPILERWFPNGLKENSENASSSSTSWLIEPNTHVFVPIDQIGKSLYHLPPSQSMWAAFGAGKRACGGRDIGLTLCTKMFSLLLVNNNDIKFRPWISHNYSGRNNDLKETWSQTYFQYKVLVHILWKLFMRPKV